MYNFWTGQSLEIDWSINSKCPTMEEYIQMVTLKTTPFAHIPVRLMQLFSEQNINLYKFTEDFGVYCQMKNDLCNLICKKVMIIQF